MKIKFFNKTQLITLLILHSQVILTFGQSEWVWGKNGNSNNNNGNGNSFNNNNNNFRPPSNSIPASPNIGTAGSNLVPINTVTIYGNGAGVVTGPSGPASPSGSQQFGNQGGSGTQPAVVVQVLHPGASGSGLQTSPAGGTGNSNFPASPLANTNNNNNANDALPANSIRNIPSVTPARGEPRFLTNQIRNFFQNAVNNLIGGGGGGGGNNNLIPGLGGLGGGNGGGLGGLGGGNGGGLGGLGGGNNGGLGGLNPNVINQIIQLAQQGGNRFPTASPLPVSSSEFNTEGNSGSGPSGPSSSVVGATCRCVAPEQCRLPFLASGSCSGGIMCCRASGTRTVNDDNNKNTRITNSGIRFQPNDLRAGLLGEIVRGTSNVIDDALDLILAPFLSQDDQQRLATRLASNRNRP